MGSMTGIDIRGLITNSLVEWEGRVSAVVFTAGCNWRCPYCHGWRFVTEPESLKPFSAQDVFALLDTQKGWLDGIVITGGEATLQPGLVDFIRDLKQTGIAVKLETNGTHPEVIEELLGANLLDCLALDYKAPLDARLQELTGVDDTRTALDSVHRAFVMAASSGIEHEYHTTLCPRFVTPETLKEMAQTLEDGGLWVLQQYEPGDILNPDAAGAAPYDSDTLDDLARIAGEHHPNVLLRKGRTA